MANLMRTHTAEQQEQAVQQLQTAATAVDAAGQRLGRAQTQEAQNAQAAKAPQEALSDEALEAAEALQEAAELGGLAARLMAALPWVAGAGAAAAVLELTCFGAGTAPRYDPKDSLAPDVCERGPQLWNRGMGLQAAHIAADFLRAQPATTEAVNLCCGVGTFVAMANAVGLDAVGVEENASRCADAHHGEE